MKLNRFRVSVRSRVARLPRALPLLASLLLLLLLRGSLLLPHAHPQPDFAGMVIAESSDAYVAYDAVGQMWEIGSASILRRMRFDPRTGYSPTLLVNRQTGKQWLAPRGLPSEDLYIQLGNETLTSSDPGFALDGYRVQVNPDGGLELVVSLARGPLRAHLHYAVYPHSSALERWVVLENAGTAPLQDLTVVDSFRLSVSPGPDPLRLYWVQGLSARAEEEDAAEPLPTLRLRSKDLSDGDAQELGSTNRSTEDSMGWFALADAANGEGMYGGVEWSGAWRLRLERELGVTRLTGGLRGLRYDIGPGQQFEAPRQFTGFYTGDLDDAANASHEFARNYLMPPHPDSFPWVQYNTWYAYTIGLDEAELYRQVDRAAELGVELFYVDAGWYEGSPAAGDFGWGLGTWRENRRKLPSGLAALSYYVHLRGMKFGLWVEPERVDLRYVGRPRGIAAGWLAPEGWSLLAQLPPSTVASVAPGSPEDAPEFAPAWDEIAPTAQLCLSHRTAREWMKNWLARLVQDYQLDWLKWDYNLYMSCDPPGEPGPGNYLHIQGLYEVLDYLRATFPDLIIENCASGGNRMDYGLMRRTHVAWLSDETEPSFRVRYLMAGASYPFPPEYLNTWLIDSAVEPLYQQSDPAALRAWLRSRMMGAFGLSISLTDLPPEFDSTLAGEIATYKQVRKVVAHGDLYRLLPQSDLELPALQTPSAPDAAMFYNRAEDAGVVFLFQGAVPWSRRRVQLEGLDAERTYEVRSADGSNTSRQTGAQLMNQGLRFRFETSRPSALYFIRPVSSPAAAEASE